MKITETFIKDLFVIEMNIFGDHRGWFQETFNQKLFEEKTGKKIEFIQDNHSMSSQIGTLRGLHFQNQPAAQTKLIRCTRGKIYDVAVDIRRDSKTYGKWFGIELSQENKKQLLVPQGFAHGFMTLEENTEVQYKVDNLYSPENDRCIIYNDKDLNIDWPLKIEPIVSEKDGKGATLKNVDSNF